MDLDLDLSLDGPALTARLVDVPSVSGAEAPLAGAIERALAPLTHLEVIRDGDAVVARTRLGRPERVILAGHLETVPVPATSRPGPKDPGSTAAGPPT